MNREDAKDLFRLDRDSYGKVRTPITKVDKIYDEFESRICENCKHYNCGCSIQDSLISVSLEKNLGMPNLNNFGCNKFEREILRSKR